MTKNSVIPTGAERSEAQWRTCSVASASRRSDRPGINPPLSFVHTQKLLQSLYFAGHNESSKPSFA
jgi:hypothetical protein